MIVSHPFKPVYNKNSRILILGTLPSQRSRDEGYPYSHPQNRFWKILEALFKDKMIDYKEFFLKHNIAYWDTVKKCDIKASSDVSIKILEVNEIDVLLLNNPQIKQVFCAGKKSYEIYQKYIFPKSNMKAICLSSTSPANASKKLDDLIEEYKIILEYLDK